MYQRLCCRSGWSGQAGPLFSRSLVSFPDCTKCVASDMVHSTACSSSASQSSPTRRPIADTPHQPLSFPLPKQWYGMKNIVYRSLQPSWFDSWTWLHYDETTDAVLCHLCTKVKILLV